MTKIIGLVVVVALAAGGWWGWRQWGGKAGSNGAAGWKTVGVGRGDIVQSVTANGALNAVKTVEVGSEVSGKIVELCADYNSGVTNGQLLARVDGSSYERQREQAEAEVESAEANLKLAEANFRRAKELREAELVSEADFDQAEATAAQARASLRMKRASLDKIRVDLEKTEIYSPIDGVVISRAVDVGQTVAASMTTPVFFTIAQDLREMRIEAEISEADVGGVEEGQEVVFTVDAYTDREFTGTVSQVRFEPVKSQNVVNYIAIVDVLNDDLKLRPGMTANASVVTVRREGALRVPNAALRFRPPEGAKTAAAGPGEGAAKDGGKPPAHPAGTENGTRRMVWVADGDGGLRGVPVVAGISDGTWTEILAGLKEGDEVVTGKADAAAALPSGGGAKGGGSPFMPGPPPRR
ncbi:MAG: efflux RND transporter periplasmic adaptor subunit [Kiritimatiellae bacterium]|nr:efflux RND transporter periplasmic adaptor subunit [Kiritimatiellia bacterium]